MLHTLIWFDMWQGLPVSEGIVHVLFKIAIMLVMRLRLRLRGKTRLLMVILVRLLLRLHLLGILDLDVHPMQVTFLCLDHDRLSLLPRYMLVNTIVAFLKLAMALVFLFKEGVNAGELVRRGLIERVMMARQVLLLD